MPQNSLREVMLSSTFRDLVEHRDHMMRVLKQRRLIAIQMEDDASLSDQDMIDASLSKVNAADAYLCIIGKRYGQIRECPRRNPQNLSLTELEFERAIERGIPVAVVQMTSAYPVADERNEFDPMRRAKLQAFRDRAGLPHRVIGEFSSWDDFLKIAPTTAADIRDAVDRQIESALSAVGKHGVTERSPGADGIPPPAAPTFHIVKPFTQGHDFVGRTSELGRITHWSHQPDPLLVFEAIGGMGKSMVTYRWAEEGGPQAPPEWAGRLWYSFYEEGASMNDFCVHALAYMEHRPPSQFRGQLTADLESLLLRHLQEKPWLIVMDGLERVLVAYNRFDRAQLRDEEAVGDPERASRDPHTCVIPADDHLLRSFATARPSKLLVSTRNMPTALLSASGTPISGVEHERLTGLEPEDAEVMLRKAGVTGDSRRMCDYLETHFECHPLMVGIVAGMINGYLPAPGQFDRWLDDPHGAAAIDLATLDGLAMKRDHILKVAYEALEPDARRLLGTLAFFSQSVSGEVLVTLNPRRPPRPTEFRMPPPPDDAGDHHLNELKSLLEEAIDPERVEEIKEAMAARRLTLERLHQEKHARARQHYEDAFALWRSSAERRSADAWLGATVLELQLRGLVISDKSTARYDLHPMVRGFVRHALKGDERAQAGRAVADYAQARSLSSHHTAMSLADLALGMEVVTALVLGGHFDDGAAALMGSIDEALHRLELHTESRALLQPFFNLGWEALPGKVSSEQLQRTLADSATAALVALGQHQQADTLCQLAIKSAVEHRLPRSAVSRLIMLAFIAGEDGKLFRRSRLLKLHAKLAADLNDRDELVENLLRQGWTAFICGDLTKASGFVDQAKSEIEHGDHQRLTWEISEWPSLEIEILKKQGKVSEKHFQEAFEVADRTGIRFRTRKLFFSFGELLHSQGSHERAIWAFEQSIAMGRASYVPDYELDANYALSLVAVGRSDEAAEIAARLVRLEHPPLAQLAKLHLALGNRSEARSFALSGYRDGWADGPPYSFHWALRDCEEVLSTLGEAIPCLSPFDARSDPALPLESDLILLVEQSKPVARGARLDS